MVKRRSNKKRGGSSCDSTVNVASNYTYSGACNAVSGNSTQKGGGPASAGYTFNADPALIGSYSSFVPYAGCNGSEYTGGGRKRTRRSRRRTATRKPAIFRRK